MTPDPDVEKIFSRAIRIRSMAKRTAYVEKVCGGNLSLRQEIDSLLKQHDRQEVLVSNGSSLSGQTLRHYQVIEQIGEGAGGKVYRALDTRLGRSVVLKILPPLLMGDSESRKRFAQEAQCLSAVNHPNIVALYDVTEDRGLTFIVMEYVAGKTLDRLIPKSGLAVRTALAYATQVAEGLVAAHSAGIIHRDLKPSNMVVTKGGFIKLIDFGLAKPRTAARAKGAPRTIDGLILGTAGYMSPEQVRGQPADRRSDIFSFGTVLYEMLSGRAAFKKDSCLETMAAILQENPPALGDRVPPDVSRIVERCLEKKPAARFASTDDLRCELRTISAARWSARNVSPHPMIETVAGNSVIRKWAVPILALALPALSWLILARHTPPPIASRVVARLAPFDGAPEGAGVTGSILKSLKRATRDCRDVDIQLLPHSIPRSADPTAIVEDERRDHASLVAWGHLQRTPEGTMVNTYLGVANDSTGIPFRHGIETSRVLVKGSDARRLGEGLAAEMRYVTLLVVGVNRYVAHDLDGAIRALTQVIAEPAPPAEMVDPAVSYYYRGLAYEALIAAGRCAETASAEGCDRRSALFNGHRAVEDFGAVLNRLPQHTDSLWHRALAYSNLCELQEIVGFTQPAQASCKLALTDFDQTLQPHPPYEHFFTSIPQEADVLWNRALTHLWRARLSILGADERLEEFTRSLSDFNRILNGQNRYADFLKKKGPEVLRCRTMAVEERDLLIKETHRARPMEGGAQHSL